MAELALIVSILAALLAGMTASRQNRIQQRLLDLETAREAERQAERGRAALTARFHRPGYGTAELTVANVGQAEARNVRITVDGTPLEDHALFKDYYTPISRLAAGVGAEFEMVTFDGMDRQYHVEIAWDNPSGEGGTWGSELRL